MTWGFYLIVFWFVFLWTSPNFGAAWEVTSASGRTATRGSIARSVPKVNGYNAFGAHWAGRKGDHSLILMRISSRIRRVALYGDRIDLFNLDATDFLRNHVSKPNTAPRSFVYLDPPYFAKGHHRVDGIICRQRPFCSKWHHHKTERLPRFTRQHRSPSKNGLRIERYTLLPVKPPARAHLAQGGPQAKDLENV